MLIEELFAIDGVSGDEKRVREYIKNLASPHVHWLKTDIMGNLIAYKKGTCPTGKRIMVCAHMDEVGFIISDISDDGTLSFKQIGGIDDRILLSRRLRIGENKVCGVIGSKPVHLQSESEKKEVKKTRDMYIDIGAKTKKEALSLVSKGDYAYFDSEFVKFGDDRFKSKAIDDRIGCHLMLEALKETYTEDIYFCFTAQEETGCRGAKILTRKLDPQYCIVLEATTASDTPYVPKHLYATSLGMGPVISLRDGGSYSDIYFNRFVTDIADKNGIKYQYKLTSAGGNDARSVQISASGCKVMTISLPCRYIHSPISSASFKDYDEMKKLLVNVLYNIHLIGDR